MQVGLTRVIIIDYREELPGEAYVLFVIGLLLNRVLVILEPAFDLVHQEELRFGVTEQVEELDRWFSPFNDIIESLVGFLETFKGRIFINVREPLTIKLIMESFESVSELGPRRHVFGSLTQCMFRFAFFEGSLRALRCQALLWRLLFLFISFDLLCCVRVKSMLHVVI